MINLVFPCPEARIIDTLAVDPKVGYSTEEIALHSDLDKSIVKDSLFKLECFHFVNQKENKYYLQKNELTVQYLIADNICSRKNNDSLHELFNSDHKKILFEAIK